MTEDKKLTKEDDFEELDRNILIFNDIKEETSEIFCSGILKILDKILKQRKDIENELSSATENNLILSLNKRYEDISKINVFVNTDGGIIREMAAIIDAIEFVKSFDIIVSTIGIGKIYSAGLGILVSGTEGHRKIGKNAKLMFHDVSDTLSGSVRNIKAELKETEKEKDFYITNLSKYTNQTKKFWQDMLKKDNDIDHFFSAQEAIEWGLVDSILEYKTK